MSLLKDKDRNEISLGEQETITIKGLSGDTQEIDFDALNNRNIVEGNAENKLIEKTKNIIYSLMAQSSALAVVA